MLKTTSSKAAWLSLATLTLLNLFNYIDRYIVSALVETLKHSELHLSDTQAGLLMTSFIAVYTLAFPVFGYFGDRASRPKLLAFGVVVWSLATIASGFAPSFAALLACRALVGIGEAAYVTIAPTLIADYFPAAQSGKAYAVFFAAIPVGSALGYVLGGLLDHHFGWRNAFLFTGIPGVFLSVMAWRLIEPRLVKSRQAGDMQAAVQAWRRLLLTPSIFMLASLGSAAYTFGLGGLAFWMPAYMERLRGASHEDAAVVTGALVVVTGFLGTFLGGFCSDLLRKKRPDADLLVCTVSVLLCVPLITISLHTASTPLFWGTLALGELLIFMSSAPINGAIIASLPVSLRAMGLALSCVISHVLGDVPSPPLIGWVSDASSLLTALMMVPVAFACCAAFWAVASRRIYKGLNEAPVAAPEQAA